MLERPGFGFVRADTSRGSAESFPAVPEPISDSEFELAVKLPYTASERGLSVTLHYGNSGKSEVQHQVLIDSLTGAPIGSIASRFWAQKKLEHLHSATDEDEDSVMQLGREYGLVTPNTSLIVLKHSINT